MLCTSRRCRILLPDRVPLNELVSSLDFRSTVTAQQLDRLRQKFLKAHRAEECPAELREDALAACTMAASVPLYVAHASGVCAYPIRPEVILHPCDCWSAIDAYCDGRFVIKSARMRHKSLELQCDGGDILVRATEARKALGLGPMAEKDLTAAVQQIIHDAVARGTILTNAEIRTELLRRGYASDRQIDAMASKFKPDSWTKPGPRTRGTKR